MKYILSLLPPLLFLSLLFAINSYLASSFNIFFGLDRIVFLQCLFWGITVFILLGTVTAVNRSALGGIVYILAGTLMGSMTYLILAVLLVNGSQWFISTPPLYNGIAALGLTALITLYGFWNAYHIRNKHLNIPLKGLKNEIKAVHLTDIHLGHCRGKGFLQEVVDKTNALSPDVVFLTGDLFDGRRNLSEDTLSPFADLKVPMYFVVGNHDNHTGVQTVKKLLRNLGVRVLENKIEVFGELQIIGLNHMLPDLDHLNIHVRALDGKSIKSVLEELPIDPSKPTILLHHSPDGIKYASKHGIDLYLTGHTHGGQLFPATLIAERIFAYNKGLHQFENTKIFISQGLGTFGPAMRIGTQSEIVAITLKPEGGNR